MARADKNVRLHRCFKIDLNYITIRKEKKDNTIVNDSHNTTRVYVKYFHTDFLNEVCLN